MGLRGKILLAVFMLLAPGLSAYAAFGVSPVYFKNADLYPGDTYAVKLNLLRSNNADEQTASLEFDIPGASEWFSCDEENPIILPAGEVRKPVRVKVAVPKDAEPGDYIGKIRILMGAGRESGNNVVLGVELNAKLKVNEHYTGHGGKIYLQVEDKGEAWYVNPVDMKRYYLGRPAQVLQVMRKLGVGARHEFIKNTASFPNGTLGKILIDVEDLGKAYYINPLDKKAYYLGKPEEAFRVIVKFGIGAANHDLDKISVGSF